MAPKRSYKQDPTPLEEAIQQRLKRAREAKGLSPEDLDELICEKPGLMRRLEAGRASLHLSRLYAICRNLNLDVDQLFADLQDHDPEPLDIAREGPSPREAETFARHYVDLKQSAHRREVSELVKSVARSMKPSTD